MQLHAQQELEQQQQRQVQVQAQHGEGEGKGKGKHLAGSSDPFALTPTPEGGAATKVRVAIALVNRYSECYLQETYFGNAHDRPCIYVCLPRVLELFFLLFVCVWIVCCDFAVWALAHPSREKRSLLPSRLRGVCRCP